MLRHAFIAPHEISMSYTEFHKLSAAPRDIKRDMAAPCATKLSGQLTFEALVRSCFKRTSVLRNAHERKPVSTRANYCRTVGRIRAEEFFAKHAIEART